MPGGRANRPHAVRVDRLARVACGVGGTNERAVVRLAFTRDRDQRRSVGAARATRGGANHAVFVARASRDGRARVVEIVDLAHTRAARRAERRSERTGALVADDRSARAAHVIAMGPHARDDHGVDARTTSAALVDRQRAVARAFARRVEDGNVAGEEKETEEDERGVVHGKDDRNRVGRARARVDTAYEAP